MFSGRATRLPLSGPAAPYDLYFEVYGHSMVAVRAFGTFAALRRNGEGVPWMNDSVAAMIVVAVHESFHRYQLEHVEPLIGQPSSWANLTPIQPYRSWLDSTWVVEALVAERQALEGVSRAPTCREAAASMHRYIAARDGRLARMPVPFRGYEDAQERTEGVANWLGYVGLHRAVADLAPDVTSIVQRDLRESFLDNHGEPYRGYEAYTMYHLYVVGAAKAQLLSECGSRDWRRRVDQGATLQGLLEELARRATEASPRARLRTQVSKSMLSSKGTARMAVEDRARGSGSVI
jgi:hypothetical protein